MGCIYHNELLHIRGALEAQLLSFPYSKFWDAMDCFANCIEMFDLGERSFTLQPLMITHSEQDDYERLREEDRNEEVISFRVL
jgi:hypothetical protein